MNSLGIEYGENNINKFRRVIKFDINKLSPSKFSISSNEMFELIIAEYFLYKKVKDYDISFIENNYKKDFEEEKDLSNRTSRVILGENKFCLSIVYNIYGKTEKAIKNFEETLPLLCGLMSFDEKLENDKFLVDRFGSGYIEHMHILTKLRRFKNIYVPIAKDYNALKEKYIPDFEWGYGDFEELVFFSLCLEEEEQRTYQGPCNKERCLINIYYGIYLYLNEEDTKKKNRYIDLIKSNTQKLMEMRTLWLYEMALIIDLTLGYPEIFTDILDKDHKIKKSLTNINYKDLNKFIEKKEESCRKNIIKLEDIDINCNLSIDLKQELIKYLNKLIITEEGLGKKENIKIEKFDLYCRNIYQQALIYYYFNNLEKSKECRDKLKNILEDGMENTLIEEKKILFVGYSNFYLAILGSLYGENNFEEYFEKSKKYLRGILDDKVIDEFDYENCDHIDESAQSFLLNAYAKLRTDDLKEFNSAVYVEEGNISDEEFVKNMEMEPFVVSGVTINDLISSAEILIKINKIRFGNQIEEENILQIIKKINMGENYTIKETENKSVEYMLSAYPLELDMQNK